MFQWLRKMFQPKAPVKELPPRNELVQWLPGCNLWVPFSANYWQDRGYPRSVAWMLYKEGLEMANELIATGRPRDGNGMYGFKGKDHGATKQSTDQRDEGSSESDLTSQANLLLAAGEALCDADVTRGDRDSSADGFTGHGGSFGGGGADAGWQAPDVSSPAAEVAAPAPDVSSSYDSSPSIDTSISDTNSSFDSSGNC